MSEWRLRYKISEINTTFGSGTSFNGTLKFSKSLKINGRYEGKIESDGFLYVEKGAEVNADIKIGTIIIGGTVRGNIIASEQLEMLEGSCVIGNIRAGKLKMAEGVVFEGKVEMLKDPSGVDILSASSQQLKQSLETW